jgi:hypothetical protein
MSFDSGDTVFFFGAGASAPFGIATMKQFVIDFEKFLSNNGTKDENILYGKIKSALEKQLKREIDLEDIFTVIDGYINFNFERLGLLSLYFFNEDLSQKTEILFSSYDAEVPICKTLREKFQNFVREKCLIPDEAFGEISEVYHDFFNRFSLESTTIGIGRRHEYSWHNSWVLFTTNYDTCLEHYWRKVAKVRLNTGFVADEATNTWVLNPNRFYEEGQSVRFFKLHGSISWQIEPDGTVTEEQTVLGRSLVGRKFVREMMIYPVQQKELYLEPHVSMLVQLNQQLKNKSNWIIIGYSFNDPVIREIFLRNSNGKKKIILVHPEADEVKYHRLIDIKGQVSLIPDRFGLKRNFRLINYSIIRQLKPSPSFSYEKTPTP